MVNQTAYNSLRQHAPRLALALLFQPERQKATLSTLLLLGLEFDRIAAQASEPMLAMIRLQWWEDQLETDCVSAGPLSSHLNQQLISGELTVDDISSLLSYWRQSIQLGMSNSADNWAQLVYLMSEKAGLKRTDFAEEIGRSVALSRAGQSVNVPSSNAIYAQAGKGSEFLICLAYLARLAAERDVTRTPFLIFGLLYQVILRPTSR